MQEHQPGLQRWSSGMDPAISYNWISHLQSQLSGARLNVQVHSGRQALWTREDKKQVQNMQQINVDSTDMLFIFPELPAKGSRHLQGHFLSQESKWEPPWLNSVAIYKGLSIRGKQEEPKFCNPFLAERSTQHAPQIRQQQAKLTSWI